MAFSDLASNQMVSYTNAQSGGFALNGGQSHVTSNECMTKDMANAIYQLASTAGSNGIPGNQLMQKSFWLGATGTVFIVAQIKDNGANIDGVTGADDYIGWSHPNTDTANTSTIYEINMYRNSTLVSTTNKGIGINYYLIDYNAIVANYGSGSYYWSIRAKTGALEWSGYSSSNTLVLPLADTTAPTAPTSLTASNIAQTTLTLNWGASSDVVGVTAYLVYKGGVLHATLGNVLTYNVTGLTANTAYAFTVYAKDAAGNMSSVSNTHNVSTLALDSTPPTTPTDLSATQYSASEVILNWTDATDDVAIAYYEVEMSTTNSTTGFANVGNTTTSDFYISGLTPSTNHWFRVRTRDTSNNLSDYSDVINQFTFE